MSTILSVQNLSAFYGKIQALENVSLEIKEKNIVTIIGSNGAGKSTTLKVLSGLLPQVSGKISLYGQEVGFQNPSWWVGKGVIHCPEGRQLFPRMSVFENLEMGSFLRRDPQVKKDLEYVFSLFPVLKERRKQLAYTLSGGEQQMVAIGRALMGRPRLLLLDEPSLGLAPLLVKKMFDTIQEIRNNGTTILLVEQNANLSLKIADYGYVLRAGTIVNGGTGQELLVSDMVRKAYLAE